LGCCGDDEWDEYYGVVDVDEVDVLVEYYGQFQVIGDV